MGEPAEFKVNEDQASEPPMEKEQVDPIPLVPYTKTFLAGDEREFATKLQEKFLQMLDEGLFQFTLRVFVLEVKELENEGVADVIIGGDLIAGFHFATRERPAALDRS
jgi:hypothetical protein